MILSFEIYCGICDSEYTDKYNKWCKPCQISSLNKMTSKNTSGNDKIDNLIKEMQLKIQTSQKKLKIDISIVFKWIPYNQFSHIKEIGKGGFSKVYFAKWKNGPLHYSVNRKKYIRDLNKKVALKCLYNSQNITNEFLNEV